MEAERQDHLEAMVSSEGPEERDAHMAIAKWLKNFFDRDGRQAELMQDQAARRAGPTESLMGSEYMSPDSDSMETTEEI